MSEKGERAKELAKLLGGKEFSEKVDEDGNIKYSSLLSFITKVPEEEIERLAEENEKVKKELKKKFLGRENNLKKAILEETDKRKEG
jgi:hypothetical protein